ncbi:hypothetical protein [Runella zeae]|uniref:hypothetical protein n=1 Tax=Runella zeae TaxID=94255 RepID=UPI00041C2913|nr:hypothetical protein [Runella zeae]
MKWFERKTIFFKPYSLAGWGLFMLTLGYCTYAFIEAKEHANSLSDVLIQWVFRVALVGVMYSVIAYFTSPEE